MPFKDKVAAMVSEPKPITTDAEADMMAGVVRSMKALDDQIVEHHAGMKTQAFQLHKTICSQENALRNPLRIAIQGRESLIGRYLREKQQRAELERRRQQEEADAKHKREVKLETKTLEKQGRPDEAEAYRQSAAANRPIVPAAPVSAPAGTKLKPPEYEAEIINADMVPREWCCPDEKKIAAYVRQVGMKAVIAGIRVQEKDPKATIRK